MSGGALRIDRIVGRALPLPGDDIDTDRIIPARFLRSVRFDGLEAHAFEDDRRAAAEQGGHHPFDAPAFQGASILLVNRNFGCGSSREHAPQALQRRGVRALVGESFSAIFFGNAVLLGLPCLSADHATVKALMAAATAAPAESMAICISALTIEAAGRTFPLGLPGPVQEAFLRGAWDPTALLLEQPEAVEAVAARLPYVQGFSDRS
jgi:3-isopropylmalate/(R)-2-methylmalate dehydratase small subunit